MLKYKNIVDNIEISGLDHPKEKKPIKKMILYSNLWIGDLTSEKEEFWQGKLCNLFV